MDGNSAVSALESSNLFARLRKQWFTLRSTNPDEMFRERTVRGMVPILAFVVIAGTLVMLISNQVEILPILAVMGIVLIATIAAIIYQQITLAGTLLFFFPVVAAVGSLISSGYLSTAGIVMSYFSVLFGAIVFPRRIAVLLPFGMVIVYALIALQVGAFGTAVTEADKLANATSPMVQSIEVAILSTLFFGIGFYLLNEFQRRRDQLAVLVATLEERVQERTRDLETARQESDAARADAEKANEVKSQFLANMSHELRTPLNAILNFTAFVSDGIMGPVNDEQVGALQQSISSGKHLLALINDVLDITKIETGMMDIFIQEVNVNEAIDVVLAMAKGLTKDKPVTLHTEIEENLPITYGDKRRLRQVFLNVVSNAVKFTPQGTVTLHLKKQDKHILLQVQDTGIGIAPENHPLVFESFKQARHELLDVQGTGLGMPISKFFVEAHGGKIWFESALGKGTTFFVELPILTEAEASKLMAHDQPTAVSA